MEQSIYKDIQMRTGGDIYVGVVGPVRTGKSTFIKKFMESAVIPNIENSFSRERALDELPQAAAGKTIMTTEPKFVPENGAAITIGGNANLNVRLVDCVGYIVPSSLGYIENDAPRMVRTPWFEEEVPFNMAAEVGTHKVITEHSTIGLVITTDGSVSDIPRSEYEDAEERVISELKSTGKPFIVILNCAYPTSIGSIELAKSLSEKYGVRVLAKSCMDIETDDVEEILESILFEFPVSEIRVNAPKWLTSLPKGHTLKSSVFGSIKESYAKICRISELSGATASILGNEYVCDAVLNTIDLGTGTAEVEVTLQADLFYKILGEQAGIEIADESALMALVIELAAAKKQYDKFKGALDEVNATGYGIVTPTMDELKLDEPKIIGHGNKYGIQLRASAPSIHMMRADITTEVSPIVGSEKQSQELVNYLLSEFEESPEKIWESNIFGKSLHELVNEGLRGKLYRMPGDARLKLQETVERIINDGCNGLICIII